jgi:hypothetical protein
MSKVNFSGIDPDLNLAQQANIPAVNFSGINLDLNLVQQAYMITGLDFLEVQQTAPQTGITC